MKDRFRPAGFVFILPSLSGAAQTGKEAVGSNVHVWDYDSGKKSVKQLSSEWEIYHPAHEGLKQESTEQLSVDTLLYGKSKVLFQGLACLEVIYARE
jgi:hypothetical protein